GGLLCRRQAGRGIVVRACHVASCPSCWVGIPARVHTYVEDACTVVNPGNWLRGLDTTESSQVDQCVGQQLHAIMPLLYTFETEEESLEFVLPRKGALDTHP